MYTQLASFYNMLFLCILRLNPVPTSYVFRTRVFSCIFGGREEIIMFSWKLVQSTGNASESKRSSWKPTWGNAIGRDNFHHTGKTSLFFCNLRNIYRTSWNCVLEKLLIAKLPFLSALLNQYACFPPQLLLVRDTTVPSCITVTSLEDEFKEMNDRERERGEGDSLCIFQRTKCGTNFLNIKTILYTVNRRRRRSRRGWRRRSYISPTVHPTMKHTTHTHSNTQSNTEKCKMWKDN